MGTALWERLRGMWEAASDLMYYDPANPMIFSTGMFLFLFTAFSLGYGFLRRRPTLRIVYTSLFSIYFYYKTGGIYFYLLFLTATWDYFLARAMGATERRGLRRMLVTLSVAANLGMLGYFKYSNLFAQIVNDLSGGHVLAFRNLFLPIGISFFVFQSLSYTIDVYRRKVTPLTNWLDYFFYLSFFPQLVAGPIVRAADFIPQIRRNPIRVTRRMFGSGMFLIMAGLFKKAVISDYISINFVDRIFDSPALYGGFENLMGVYGYALQIYCDFSGYSDMAIGIALLLGFRFRENFNLPYKSATITEFWRRWHISLSTWLRDYLYVSLGGNRRGRVRTYFNLMITMLLGGLWHGAAPRFVLWGGFHGAGLAVHKLLRHRFPRLKATGAEMKRGWRFLGIVFTFHFVCLGWVFFRAGSIETGVEMLRQIFENFDLGQVLYVIKGYWKPFAFILLGFTLHFLPRRFHSSLRLRIMRNSLAVNAILMVALIWIVMQLKSGGIQPFIYFQF
jgi:D-alanyl-lipoteichoic acid acyltransferase DltB (MBOAT superfamily)